MDALQRYLFDINGYLILEDVLNAGEVAELNRLVDQQHLPDPGLTTAGARFGASGSLFDDDNRSAGFLDWGGPFRDLLDHPAIMKPLIFFLGDGFRIDHYYGIYMREGTERLRLHGGNTPYDPPEYYHVRDGRMFNGLTVVSWNLCDTGPEHGGFCCVAGSHKANYPCPQEVLEGHEVANGVVTPFVSAGSVVIFTEALTHGTARWKAGFQRRSLLFKYSPAQQSWGPNYPAPPEAELTERQRKLFEKPYFARRASLLDDGPPDG